MRLNGSGNDLRSSGKASVPVHKSSLTNEKHMEQILVQFLKQKGYVVQRNSSDQSSDEKDPVTLEQFAAELGLSTEHCIANHVLYYGLTKGSPRQFQDTYEKVTNWIANSLDMFKNELHVISFPLFVHFYLELVTKDFLEEASEFLAKYSMDHRRLHRTELNYLSLINSAEKLRDSEYAQRVLRSKFNIKLSLLAFELLNAFLSKEELFLALAVLNERVDIVVSKRQVGLQAREVDDSLEEIEDMTEASKSISYKSPDALAKEIAHAPNESEIGTLLPNGNYDVEYTVCAAGGHGHRIEDLNRVAIRWGVFPPRKLPQEEEANQENATDGAAGANGAGGASSASGAAGNDGASGGATLGNAGASTASGSGSGAGATAQGSGKTDAKGSDKASSGGGGGGSGGGSGDVDKKKRKGSTSEDKRKHDEPMGPLPDRKSPYNAEILEKLVLRLPSELKVKELEDGRVRVKLDKDSLPSALCFSIVNASTSATNVIFSDDVALVGATFEDASFRVWRNDDQPLGTSAGVHESTIHKNVPQEEREAILRGHSSAVYGASFSPDNRFVLTSSADSTIRLWSLAARANLVCYRSHTHPVWDVNFSSLGYYFVSCSMDRTARLWSTDRLHPLRIFAGHLSDVDCVQFHPNQNYIATGSADKTVRLWDVQSGNCVRIFTGHFNGVKCVAFSPNGRYLASSGDDKYINIWDLHAGKRLETLVGHKASVYSMVFSQESSLLASGSADSTVRLWDMKTCVASACSGSYLNVSGSGSSHSHSHSSSSTSSSSNSNSNSNNHKAALGMSSATGHDPALATSQDFVKRINWLKPALVEEMQPSRFLLKTLRAKQTPIYRVKFTNRNLLLTGGNYMPTTSSTLSAT